MNEKQKHPLEITLRKLLTNGMLAKGEEAFHILVDIDQDPHQQRVTLWHEVIHLLWMAGGRENSKQHEEVVEKLAERWAIICPEITQLCLGEDIPAVPMIEEPPARIYRRSYTSEAYKTVVRELGLEGGATPTIKLKLYEDKHKGEAWLIGEDDVSRDLMWHLGFPAVEPEKRNRFDTLVAAHGWNLVMVEDEEGVEA